MNPVMLTGNDRRVVAIHYAAAIASDHEVGLTDLGVATCAVGAFLALGDNLNPGRGQIEEIGRAHMQKGGG